MNDKENAREAEVDMKDFYIFDGLEILFVYLFCLFVC
jgi:hypothetical protein